MWATLGGAVRIEGTRQCSYSSKTYNIAESTTMKIRKALLLLWLVLLGVGHSLAAIVHAPENRVWEFFNIRYDAIGHASVDYDGSEKPSSAYDVCPSRAQTDNERRMGHNAPLLLYSVDFLPQREVGVR